MLESASNYTQVSKKLLKIANLLEYNVNLANEPAVVNIKSDDKTDIKLKKVGIIGKVKNKTLSLKAGKYIFEGKRLGYKTILIEKEIALEEKNVFLEIICIPKGRLSEMEPHGMTIEGPPNNVTP